MAVRASMSLSITRYALMLLIQMSLLVSDLLINSFSELFVNARHYSTILLAVYLFQDVCIIFAFMTLMLSFFTTTAFLAGSGQLLLQQYSGTLIAITTYLLLTISWQYWSLSVRWDTPNVYNWSNNMDILFFIQRTAAVIYYYLYKRAVLLMSDPRLYMDLPKMNGQLHKSQLRI